MILSDPKNLAEISNDLLTENFRKVAVIERHATADLIAHIREFAKRRLYLEQGCTSIFAYMTKVLGYSEPTAQNRIDAARFIEAVPRLLTDLYSGQINLTQISLLAQSVRQKENESLGEKVSDEKKLELVEKIRGLDSKSSAVIVARELDLTLKTRERLRYQKDESVILEVTLSKEQIAELRRIRELTSHQAHNANWADIISLATRFYLSKRDPEFEKVPRPPNLSISKNQAAVQSKRPARKPVPAPARRMVLQRDQGCRWVDPKTGKRCGSKFQLQVDHIRPVWADGGNEIENLQALCAVHNRFKYSKGN